MEGVVYQYEPSLRAEIDEEQAKIAMSLLAVDTESSSEVPFAVVERYWYYSTFTRTDISSINNQQVWGRMHMI